VVVVPFDRPFLLPIAMFLFLTSANSRTVRGADVITVELTSGRTFTAVVDSRTGEDRLWLRFGDGSTTLLRPIAWDRIVRAEQDGQALSATDLRKIAETASETPEDPSLGNEAASVPAGHDERPSGNARHFLSLAELARAALAVAPPVRSVEFDAQLTNWDADAEADGLLLKIRPLDSLGRCVIVEGVVDVDLVGALRRDGSKRPQGRGRERIQLGRWTKQLRAEDAGPSGFVVSLALPSARSDQGSPLEPFGNIRVRLVVPGQGVFEQTQYAVRVRPFAP
jgi:hypothetical protein